MRWISLVLLVLLSLLQYRLWFGKHSVPDYWQMEKEIELMREHNQSLRQRNNIIQADIQDLRTGLDAVEERARNELGLIKDGETFYRIIPE